MSVSRTSAPWPVIVAVVPALVASAIGGYQLAQPDALTGLHGSDDGIWLAPAIRLVHGALPYRDYVWVHPPGIALLLSPLGLLGSTRDALIASRVLTVVVMGMNASLAAVVVRHRGAVAMLVSGMALAVFPHAVALSHSVGIDPYLTFFCLLGAVVMFRGGSIARRRRVFLAGLLLGLAALTKLWGVVPAIAAFAICMPRWRSAVVPLVSGGAVGFALPVLPFLVLAPGSFVHDVLLSQVGRSPTGQGYTSLGERLQLLFGLVPSLSGTRTLIAGLLVGLAVLLVLVVFVVWFRSLRRLEWYALLATVLTGGLMLFAVAELYTYYAYFVASFAALLVGLCAARIAEGLRWLGRHAPGRRAGELVAYGTVPGAAVVAATVLIPANISYATTFVRAAYDSRPTITQSLPAGACSLSDEAGNLIDSDRFSSPPGCPDVVDAFGLWLTDNNGVPPPGPVRSQAFTAEWSAWLHKADYVVLSYPLSDYLPWNPGLIAWFNGNFTLVASRPSVYVYKRARTSSDLVSAGIAAQKAGNLATALHEYAAALQIDPADSPAYFDLGTVYDAQGRHAQAEAEYRAAVAVNPTFVFALFNLAVDTAPSDPQGAEALYRKVVTLQPSWAGAWLNLGFVLQSEGRSADARAAWAMAVSIDPSLGTRVPK